MIMTPGLCAGMTPPGTETQRGGDTHCEAEDAVQELHLQKMSCFVRMLGIVTQSEVAKTINTSLLL